MLKAIILAAGEGTRMKSEKTKVLHKICGYTLIQHVLDAVKEGGFDEIIAVLGRNREAVEKELESCPCTIVSQELGENKPYGTGYAVQLCQEYVEPEDHVVVAPHITEELHQRLGFEQQISQSQWPTYDENLTIDDSIEIPVQINGKLKARLVISRDEGESSVLDKAFELDEVKKEMDGKALIKKIYVPNKIVNLVVK